MWPCKVASIRRHGEDSISLLVSSFDSWTRISERDTENFRNFYDAVLPIKRKLNDSMANLPIEKE